MIRHVLTAPVLALTSLIAAPGWGVAQIQGGKAGAEAYAAGVSAFKGGDRYMARHLFEESAAAGNIDAAAQLGSMLLEGIGGPADATRAGQWLRVAAEAGIPDARGRVVRTSQKYRLTRLAGLIKFERMKIEHAAKQLEALGNQTRLQIYRTLVRAGEPGLPVGRLQERIGIAASTLSHHLHRLILTGLVSQERQSTVLICRANYSAMNGLLGFSLFRMLRGRRLCSEFQDCRRLNFFIQISKFLEDWRGWP